MGLPPVETVMSEDKYLYHTTSKSNKRSINRNGLDPSKKKPDGPYDTTYAPKADKFIRKIAEKTNHELPFSRDECVFFFTLWDHIEEMHRGGQKDDSLVFVVDATKIESPLYFADAMAYTEVMDGFAMRDGVFHSEMMGAGELSPDEMANHAVRYLESIEKVDDVEGLKDRAWEAAHEQNVLEVVVPDLVNKDAIVGSLSKD